MKVLELVKKALSHDTTLRNRHSLGMSQNPKLRSVENFWTLKRRTSAAIPTYPVSSLNSLAHFGISIPTCR